jgi:nucleotide-binding universal stress UspA family protein
MSESKSQIVCSDLDSCQIGSSTIKRILVPFDSSKYSERAFALALDLAHHYGATLTTLTILYEDPANYLSIEHQTTIDKEKFDKIQEKFKTLKSSAKKFGISVKNDVFKRSDVLEPILSYITEYKIDLVVMGSRGRTGPHQYVLGSIALGVCKNAKCPVMLVK